MAEQQPFQILAALHGLAGVFWLLSALSAFAGYVAFKQTVDLGWSIAFLTLALAKMGYVWSALQYADRLPFATRDAIDFVQVTSYYGVRFATVEVAAAFAVLYLFRARRRVF